MQSGNATEPYDGARVLSPMTAPRVPFSDVPYLRWNFIRGSPYTLYEAASEWLHRPRPKPLTPADADEFDYVLLGGLLGDDPPCGAPRRRRDDLSDSRMTELQGA